MKNKLIAKTRALARKYALALIAILAVISIQLFNSDDYQHSKTVETSALDSFKNKPSPSVINKGVYAGVLGDGKGEVEIQYIFEDNNTIIKTYRVKNNLIKKSAYAERIITLTGSAKYYFEGSVMLFTEVLGDDYVFNSEGEAIIIGEHSIRLFDNKADGNLLTVLTRQPSNTKQGDKRNEKRNDY